MNAWIETKIDMFGHQVYWVLINYTQVYRATSREAAEDYMLFWQSKLTV